MQNAAAVLREAAEEELSKLDPGGAALEAANHVIDLDAAESSCPACMGAIPKGSPRCPDCGLRFA